MDNFQFSSQEFYDEIEKELAARQASGLAVSRVDFHEGSVLSDKRTYLRLARERYVFGVCAAPFSREFFFSLRFVEKPRPGWLALLAMLFLLYIIVTVASRIGIWFLVVAIVATVVFVLIKSINAADARADKGKLDTQASAQAPAIASVIDDFFLNLPVLGQWYERFRKDTYYRFDTRIIYHTLITKIVKMKVEEVTAAKGVKLIRSYEYSPILGELYKMSATKPAAPSNEA